MLDNPGDYTVLPEVSQPSHGEESYDLDRQQKRVGWIVNRSVGSVLEIGCAEGYILSQMTRENLYGIDFDQARIRRARLRYPNITFYVVDVRYGLPCPEQWFDTVVLAEILEHMDFSDAEYVLQEAYRVCREKVLITVPYKGGEKWYEEDVYSESHLWIPDAESMGRLLADYNCTHTMTNGFMCVEIPNC